LFPRTYCDSAVGMTTEEEEKGKICTGRRAEGIDQTEETLGHHTKMHEARENYSEHDQPGQNDMLAPSRNWQAQSLYPGSQRSCSQKNSVENVVSSLQSGSLLFLLLLFFLVVFLVVFLLLFFFLLAACITTGVSL